MVDIARFVRVSELLSGNPVQEDDGPTGILLQEGSTVYRARIYGIVVSVNDLVVDDGSGSILVRNFNSSFDVNVGDSVLVIGRPRVYEGQCYVLGEIVKRIDTGWFKVRDKLRPRSDPLGVVRSLDDGDGAGYEAVVAVLGEEKVVHLLSVGDLFETRPGRLKVLE